MWGFSNFFKSQDQELRNAISASDEKGLEKLLSNNMYQEH